MGVPHFLLLVALATLPAPLAAGTEWVREVGGAQEVQVRVWLDRGNDPVLSRGDRARIYYHVSEDAYLAIFHVDTNGTVQLLYPGTPAEVDWVRGGRDYRLLFPRSTYWFVEDDPGMGYFFAIASPEPMDFSRFRYSRFEGGWDLQRVGRQVYKDPYVAMDEYVAALVPDWEYVPYALDFTSYHVGREYEYPRFMCYDCHGFRPWSSWNPYLSACVDFRVVVYNDPYYYPAYRYSGTRVVFVRPPAPGLARFAFKERGRGESSAPLIQERNSSGRALPPADRRVTPGSGGDPLGPARRSPAVESGNPQAAPSRVPGRPSESLPDARRPGGREMPSLERRPSGQPSRETPARETPARVAPSRGETPVSPPPARSTPPARGTSSPPARSTPPTRGTSPPPARSTPPARGTSPPPARSTPPARGTSPPPARSTPPTRGSSPPPARSAPSTRGSSPPPARSAPSTGSSSPPPARSAPSTRSTSPPPARGTSPPPARSTPPTRGTSPPPARSAPSTGSSSPPPARSTPPPRRPPPPGGDQQGGLGIPPLH